ncbi:MAG: helix-turn-helix domain-containing protein [Fibromonadales bacterium]|nr:helix-turn-helix domain-containing protein [Fibromonadales bacterium]
MQKLLSNGMSKKEAAKMFGVSVASLYRFLR